MVQVDPQDRLKLAEKVYLEVVDGQRFLYNHHDYSVHRLGKYLYAALELCDGCKSVTEILQALGLASDCDISVTMIKFLDDLVKLGYVEIVGTKSSN